MLQARSLRTLGHDSGSCRQGMDLCKDSLDLQGHWRIPLQGHPIRLQWAPRCMLFRASDELRKAKLKQFKTIFASSCYLLKHLSASNLHRYSTSPYTS